MNLNESQPSAARARATVVIITHDRREELLCTLAHMSALPDRVPIVVVDNASRDGTADAVAASYPRITLVRANANLGALGRNLAVRDLRTPYVAFCDDDVRWQAGALSGAADLLDAYPALASVTARILVEPDLEEDPLMPELRESPVPGPSWLPGPALLSVLAGASIFRVAAFRQVGGFSPRLWASASAIGEAVAGLPWVLRERRVVPPQVEEGLRLLEEPQRRSTARRYVG